MADLSSFAIENFLGLVTNYTDTMIAPGLAKRAVDIDWRNSKGALQGSKASVRLYNRGESVFGIHIYKNVALYTLSTMCYYGDVKYQIDPTTDWGSIAVFEDIDDIVVGVNGSVPIIFDGSYLDKMGTSVPVVTSMTAVGTGSGSFTVGVWDYYVTFVNRRDFEGNMSAKVTATSTGGGKASCNLTNIPVGDPGEGIKARRIFRTPSGGGNAYLVHEISDNTTTTYSDTTIDANLGTMSPPENSNKPPQDVTMIARVGKRLYAAGSSTYPRRLYYSYPIPDYEGWPLTYYDDFPSTIIALLPLGTSLLVLTETGPVLFNGLDDPSTMYQRELPSHIPASYILGVASYNNQGYWIGPSGIFTTSGVTVEEITQIITEFFPPALGCSGMVIDSYGTLLVILNYTAFDNNSGRIVELLYTGQTTSFGSEVGIIVQITSATDTWTFTSETGKIVGLSYAGDTPAVTILKTLRGQDEIWSLDSTIMKCIAHNTGNRFTYVGRGDGVYTLEAGARRSWLWQSVYSNFNDQILRKRLEKIRIRLQGTVTVTIYGDDDVVLHTETITETEIVSHEMFMPPASWAYKFSIKLEGTTSGLVEPPIVYFYEPERL
jgi:hypothetical protein